MAKSVTQKMVADLAGVARATAALILSNHASAMRFSPTTRQRVLDAARKLNYRPSEVARQLRGERTSIIGVLIGTMDSQANYRCLSVIEQLVTQRGYRLLIGQLDRDSGGAQDYARDFLSRGISSVICLQHESPLQDWKQVPRALADIEHVVYLDRPAGIRNSCYVQQDFSAGIRQSVEHVISKGARRIGILLDSLEASCNQHRFNGYRDALKQAGIPFDSHLVSICDRIVPPEIARIRQFLSQQEIVKKLVVEQRADALILESDLWAVEALYQVMDLGYRVPEDVKVVGYDNIDVSLACRPRLTTLDPQPAYLASLLVDRIFALQSSNPVAVKPVTIQPKLIIRESTDASSHSRTFETSDNTESSSDK